MTKVCKDCPENGEQPINNFYLLKQQKRNKNYFFGRCKKCYYIHQKKNKTDDFKKKRKDYMNNWRKNNKNKILKYKQAYSLKRIKNLGSEYVVAKLIINTNLKTCDIPLELIELKRKQLQLKRDAKKAKENNN